MCFNADYYYIIAAGHNINVLFQPTDAHIYYYILHADDATAAIASGRDTYKMCMLAHRITTR